VAHWQAKQGVVSVVVEADTQQDAIAKVRALGLPFGVDEGNVMSVRRPDPHPMRAGSRAESAALLLRLGFFQTRRYLFGMGCTMIGPSGRAIEDKSDNKSLVFWVRAERLTVHEREEIKQLSGYIFEAI